MFCHGELVKRKPAPQYLTSFYLMLSIGGALAGSSWVSSRHGAAGVFRAGNPLSASAVLMLAVIDYRPGGSQSLSAGPWQWCNVASCAYVSSYQESARRW